MRRKASSSTQEEEAEDQGKEDQGKCRYINKTRDLVTKDMEKSAKDMECLLFLSHCWQCCSLGVPGPERKPSQE